MANVLSAMQLFHFDNARLYIAQYCDGFIHAVEILLKSLKYEYVKA